MAGWRLMDEAKKTTRDVLEAVAERQQLPRNPTLLELLEDAPLHSKRMISELFYQPQYSSR
jgi:hypothetical protein